MLSGLSDSALPRVVGDLTPPVEVGWDPPALLSAREAVVGHASGRAKHHLLLNSLPPSRYIIYDIAQVNLKYLLKLKFNFKTSLW